MNDDPIDLVTAIAPDVTESPEVLARVRSNLMTSIEPTPVEATAATQPKGDRIPIDRRPRRTRRARRRLVPLAAVAAVLAGATGTAWAVFANHDSAETTSLSCPTPAGSHSGAVDPDGQSIIATVSGDPIIDCTAEWRRQSSAPAPAMTAYDNGKGAVVVLAAAATPPAGYTALPRGAYQHADVAALQRRLDDVAIGLDAHCLGLDAAKRHVESTLAELGMTGWTVEQAHPGRVADGKANCAAAVVDGATHTVGVVGAGPDGGVHPFAPFATEVHAAVEHACVGTAAAAAQVRRIAAHTTVDNGGTVVDLGAPDVVDISTVDVPDAECTTVTVTVGGNVSVTLAGPGQSSGPDDN